jgi:putative glycosyltransferase
MQLSVVTTLYRSDSTIEEFYSRIKEAVAKIETDHEIIFVNDGSPDNSGALALSLFKRDERVKVIDLSRNFGHHKAMMTGLAAASGNLIFLIDCDLEEQPEWLSEFHDKLASTQADVVYGIQNQRKGSLFERVSGAIFFWVFNRMSGTPIPPNLLTVRLMSRRYVRNLIRHRERATIIAGLWELTGFKQVEIKLDKKARGRTTYNFIKKIEVLVDAVASFSSLPLVAVFYLGSLISILSVIATIYLIALRVFYGVFLVGWPSLIVSIWLMGGLIIFSIGLIGIYISKIFIETKNRPYTIVRDIYEHENGNGPQRNP